MILVLAHHYDAEAVWLCDAIRQYLGEPAPLLWPEALGVDYSISLRLASDGCREAGVRFFQRPEDSFDAMSARYVVNRLGYIDSLIWKKAAAAEKAYAEAEINAFFSAFLRALPCPASNPVRNGALWASPGFSVRWASRLKRAGAPVHPLADAGDGEALTAMSRVDPAATRRWLHLGGGVMSPPTQRQSYPDVERAILNWAPDEMLEFVAIEDRATSRPQVIWVSRTPALSCYGEQFVHALTAATERTSA